MKKPLSSAPDRTSYFHDLAAARQELAEWVTLKGQDLMREWPLYDGMSADKVRVTCKIGEKAKIFFVKSNGAELELTEENLPESKYFPHLQNRLVTITHDARIWKVTQRRRPPRESGTQIVDSDDLLVPDRKHLH